MGDADRLDETPDGSSNTTRSPRKRKVDPSSCSLAKNDAKSDHAQIDRLVKSLQLRSPARMEDIHHLCNVLRDRIAAAGGERTGPQLH